MNEQQIAKRNYIFMLIEGCLIFSCFTMLDNNSVIPVFIDTYTKSLQLAGLATSLRMIFFFSPNFLIGPYINKIESIPGFIKRVTLIFRPSILLIIPILFSNIGPYAKVWIFLVLYAIFWTGEGLLNIPWLDLFGRTIPGETRGKVFGYQQLLGGIGGIACGFIIKTVLENQSLSDSIKYTIIFGSAGVLGLLSALCMLPLRDIPKNRILRPANLRSYFSQLPEKLSGNREFVKINVIQGISNLAGIIIPFIILFSKDTFNLDSSEVSTLVYIQILGNLVGGFIWANLSHRFGNKYSVMASQIIALLISVMSLISLNFKGIGIPFVLLWLITFLNGIYMGSWAGFINYIIDVIDEENRTIYIFLNNLLMFPFTMLSYLAGIVASIFGFVPLFATSIAAGTATVILSTFLKSPRQLELIKE